jgi:hypothetical protein
MNGSNVSLFVVHDVARVLDAHEDAVGDALARPLPVRALVLVAQPNDLASEHVRDHAVLVVEVRHAAAVSLHPSRLAVLLGAAVVQVERVLVRQRLIPPHVRA